MELHAEANLVAHRPVRQGEFRLRRTGPFSAVIDVFDSIWLGIALIVLIFIYSAAGSAVPTFRQFFELTEFQYFNHPVFVTLIILFCLTLTVTTLRRIRFNLRNAGVLTVHSGLLILCAGSIVYFGRKIEGDVLLEAPRIRVVSIDRFETSPESAVLGSFVAVKGSKWDTDIPMLGGRHRIEVTDVRHEGMITAAKVTLQAQVGDQAPQTLELKQTGGSPFARLNDRLALWLVKANTAEAFYDDSSPALLVSGGGGRESFELPMLPYYNARFVEQPERIQDLTGQPVRSARLWPVPLLERWRMPIELGDPDRASASDWPVRFSIDGYLPYARLDPRPIAGGERLMPIARVRLDGSGEPSDDWLVAQMPEQSLLETSGGASAEFVWLGDKEQLDPRWTQSLQGSHVLEVLVKDRGVQRTYDVSAGQKISVEGTDYVLTVEELRPSWPLMSPGFQNARTPIALVWVESPNRKFQRSVLQRYPQLNQDRDREGKKILQTGGSVDENLELFYTDASHHHFLIAAGEKLAPTLVHTAPGGKRTVQKLEIGRTFRPHGPEAHAPSSGAGPSLTLTEFFEKPEFVKVPTPIPQRQQRPLASVRRSESLIRVHLKSTQSDWEKRVWVPFSQYNGQHDAVEPTIVEDVPGVGTLQLIYGRTPRPLPARMTLERLQTDFYPGRQQPREWTSYFRYEDPQNGAVLRGKAYLNNTARVGDWTFFQSQASGDHESWTVLGVGNRMGVMTMLLGCVLITLGMAFAFCVKPVLAERYKRGFTVRAGRRES